MSPVMQRTRPESCLSDLVLDRVLAGEIPRPEHLAGCEACGARLSALESQRGELPGQVWIAGEARKVKRRLVPAGLLAAAAAAAVVMVAVRPLEPVPAERTKGGLSLALYARGADGRVEELLPGARVRAGDAVRFSVSTLVEGHVAVVGADAAGGVAVHAAPPAPLPAGKGQLLEGSLILDEAVGPERFVAVLCDGTPAAARIEAAARTALAAAGGDPRGMGELVLDCRQASFLVEKVAR
jgi:hypothetical protein